MLINLLETFIKMKFLINNFIVYNSDDGSLVNKTRPDDIIVLPHMAARVLTCLLINAGKVVPREAIFDYVWSGNEMLASNNSLTQYVSFIRKTLTDLECQEELIKTIPRVGFYLSGDNVSNYKNGGFSLLKDVFFSKYLFAILSFMILLLVLIYQVFFLKDRLTNKELFYFSEIDSCKIYTLKKVSEHDFASIRSRIEKMVENESFNIACTKGFSYVYQSDERISLEGKGREFISRCNISSEKNNIISACNGVYINARNY